MACPPQLAPGLVAVMARRLVALPEYDRQLHVIYLANDILFKSCVPPGVHHSHLRRDIEPRPASQRAMHALTPRSLPPRRLQSRLVGAHHASDPIAAAFAPALGVMLAAAYQRAGRADEVRPGQMRALSSPLCARVCLCS